MELEQDDEIGVNEVESFSEGLPAKLWQAGANGELDLPPEYCRYRDEGCDLADSCLNCPFAKCIYDEPGGKQHWLKRWRAREMVRLFTIEGKKIKELSQMFGVSQRTVQRALKKEIPLNPPFDKIRASSLEKGETGRGYLAKGETERGQRNE